MQPIFPVWGLPTRELAISMIESGMRAKLTCIDSKVLAPEFVGREFNEQLLSDLPPEIDPCGENGEFHTFWYAGPMFKRNLSVEVREIHELSAVQSHAFSSRNPNCNMRLMRSLSESQH